MQPINKILEDHLEEWAKWARQSHDIHLYYPSESPIAKIKRYGIVLDKNLSPKPLPENRVAEQMDRLLAELSLDYEIEAKTLMKYYLYHRQKEVVAGLFKTSSRNIEFRIKTAMTWLNGRYSAKLAS